MAKSKLSKRIARRFGFQKPTKLMRYAEFLEQEEVNPKAFLLESRHGDAFEGNIYYIARAILSNPEYSDYSVIIPARKKRRALVEESVGTLPGNPTIITLDSIEYYHALATSKFLINDTSFEHCFYKRPDQVYINTWHGTPLKYLGRRVVTERVRMSNVQRNFLCADYLLYPNEHTKRAIFNDYMLDGLFTNKILYAGYPRNEVFFQKELQDSIRSRYNLSDKRVYTYMPTYRGLNRALYGSQFSDLADHLEAMDEELTDDEVLYLNLHPFMAGSISCDDYKHIELFPSDVPAYDFLSCADALITDYSSVMFDFACSGKPVVLFTYDLEDYYSDRGAYINVADLPFCKAFDAREAIDAVRSPNQDYREVQERFCSFDSKTASKDLVDFLINGNNHSFVIEESNSESKKPTVLITVDGIDPACINDLVASIYNDPSFEKASYYISFRRTDRYAREIIDTLDEKIGFFSLGGKACLTPKEKQALLSYKKGKKTIDELNAVLSTFYHREFQRRYGVTHFDFACNIGVYKLRNFMLLLSGSDQTDYYVPLKFKSEVIAPKPSKTEASFFSKMAHSYTEMREGEMCEALIDEETINGGGYSLFLPRFVNSSTSMNINGFIRISSPFLQSIDKLRIQVGEKVYVPSCKNILSGDTHIKKGRKFYRFSLSIPYDELHSFSIQNYMKAFFAAGDKMIKPRAIRYNWIRNSYRSAHGKMHFDDATGTTSFFRQTKKGNVALTVRHRNITDSPVSQLKLKSAWLLAKVVPFMEPKILLFEKNSKKYEEGAKVLFEYLIDHNYRNVRFILDKESIETLRGTIPQKYINNFIQAHSFLHYLNFFRSSTFIGTETMAHSLELRVEERHAKQKLVSRENTYVFLQHGPTYMVSLDSPQRTFFRKSEQPGRMFIAANSEKEKAHFVELGGFDPESILVCGMPKFDSAFAYPDADKIVIMPTWRAWEFNEVRFNPQETKYWKMIERIRASIPGELQDKVVLQAHPLFNTSETGEIKQNRSIDELLRSTRVLITDYSSVAYDAFYRGANVIFYWEEKEECMEHYGAPTHLMIDEDTAPGFICYKPAEVTSIIGAAYSNPQPQDLIERYRDIVEFHDGHNTQRLVNMMHERNIL